MNIPPRIKEHLNALGLQAKRARVFGVEYLHIALPDGGDLYLTEFGVPSLEYLLPENWRDAEYYEQDDKKHLKVALRGSAHPFRITTKPVHGRSIDIVTKWCRVGSEVLVGQTKKIDLIPDEDMLTARWNGPFEEIGLLMEFRNTNRFHEKKIHTSHPLGIYAPPEKYKPWQTGRNKSRMWLHHKRLREDQDGLPDDESIDLDIQRLYCLIYRWVKGEDAACAFERLNLDTQELEQFTFDVYRNDLKSRGYKVLDTKPEHFIVRERNGDLLRDKEGNLEFALIDFELLQRTEDYEKKFQIAQRSRYWHIQKHKEKKLKPLPEDYYYMNILGVDYVYGPASNRGRLWVVGNDPDLFDYYDPSRWRRTPRIRLSEVSYRTRSFNNIQLVYRRSRVNMMPQQDPSTLKGRVARRFGHNSPFEEVAIAEELRKVGIGTVHPRAVYRTAHESLPAEWLASDSRFQSHKDLICEDGEPVLSADYDYYLLYGCWMGGDTLEHYSEKGPWGHRDLEQACAEGLISEEEEQQVIEDCVTRLKKIGFSENIRYDRFVVTIQDGEFVRDSSGRLRIMLIINGYRAYEKELLTLDEYHDFMETNRIKLARHGYRVHNLKGDHFLLSMDLDGNLNRTPNGELETVLCNFELMQAPWMKY